MASPLQAISGMFSIPPLVSLEQCVLIRDRAGAPKEENEQWKS
jgi:hypothetical protein